MNYPHFGTTRFKNTSIGLLALTLAVCSILVTHNLRIGQHVANEALVSLKDSAADVREYVAVQKASLEDPRNKKALDAAIQAGAVLNGSFRLLNTQTIPRINKGVDALTGTATSLTDFVDVTKHRFNDEGGLIPTATRTIADVGALATNLATVATKAGITVDDLSIAIKTAAATANKDLDAVYDLIARPEIVSILQHVDGTTLNIQTASKEVADALAKAPGIAESLDKIAKTSSRFTKVTLIANVIGILAKAFLP